MNLSTLLENILLFEGAQRVYNETLRVWAMNMLGGTRLNEKSKKVFAKWLLDSVMEHHFETTPEAIFDVSMNPNRQKARYFFNLYNTKV